MILLKVVVQYINDPYDSMMFADGENWKDFDMVFGKLDISSVHAGAVSMLLQTRS